MSAAPDDRSPAERDANLGRLADYLLARHIRIAVPDLDARDQLVTKGEAKYNVELVEREMHCIAIVGAGASDAVLKRSNELADELEAEFGRDVEELERLRLVNNLDRADFETRLVALGKSPAAERRVRERVAEIYGVRCPSLIGYELLAHLLKHRFLDAIITFNFDELLDQSLDDELHTNEYVRVVSERDCGDDVVIDPDARDYVPLYVKLHGTASEPESLRYTPQSYYALPPRILSAVSRLMNCDHCVILNAGSNLGSFDIQRLLRIPRELEVFNLGRRCVPESVAHKIGLERRQAGSGDQGGDRCEEQEEEHATWLLDCNARGEDCDRLMSRLTKHLGERARAERDGLVDFRSVRRHMTLDRLLGPRTLHRGDWLGDPEWARREWAAYCRRRTILELAFAGAKARGLLSMGPLATDRPARYFDRYRQHTREPSDDWHKLCAAAGLMESGDTPDVLYALPELRLEVPEDEKRPADRRLNEFDVEKLARHVLTRIKNPSDPRDLAHLRKTLEQLQDGADVEFHMRDDRVCSKAFEQPATLPTATSRRAYTWLMLQDLGPEDEVHVSAETGNWLLYDKVKNDLLKDVGRIRLLLAFGRVRERLEQEYGDRIEIVVIDPWRHNRHMTIVCRGGVPTNAIYFARRLRAPVVTAVYLRSARDVMRLMRLYDDRWNEGAHYDLTPFKRALEAGAVDRLLSFYDVHAEWVDHRTTSDPPALPRMLRGRGEIAEHMHEAATRGAVYVVSDERVNDAHAAFAVTASFPDGGQTRRHVYLYLKNGLIARRIDIEADGRREPESGDAGN